MRQRKAHKELEQGLHNHCLYLVEERLTRANFLIEEGHYIRVEYTGDCRSRHPDNIGSPFLHEECLKIRNHLSCEHLSYENLSLPHSHHSNQYTTRKLELQDNVEGLPLIIALT